jgi:hypothetical protein
LSDNVNTDVAIDKSAVGLVSANLSISININDSNDGNIKPRKGSIYFWCPFYKLPLSTKSYVSNNP